MGVPAALLTGSAPTAPEVGPPLAVGVAVVELLLTVADSLGVPVGEEFRVMVVALEMAALASAGEMVLVLAAELMLLVLFSERLPAVLTICPRTSD